MRRSSVRTLAAGVTAAVALGAAGCAAESAKSKSASNAAAPAPTGKKATGVPIKIGFINNEGGAFSVPELRVGSEVAVDHVNNVLGGIKGRPLEVVRCNSDGSPEKSIDCANKLVEAKVALVQQGTDLGSDAILPILKDAKIPMVGHVQFGPAQMGDPNSYFFGAAAAAYGGVSLKFYADQGAKSIAWLLPDVPSSHAFSDGILTPTAAQLKLKYKTIYYDAAAPNWSVLATTVVSDKPDVSGTIAAADGQCVAMIGALRDAGYKGSILAASCSGLYKALGEKAVGVHVDADHWNQNDAASAPADKQAEIATYVAAMKAAGQDKLIDGNAVITFADTINLAKVLSAATGTIDGAGVTAALKATKGMDSFLGPKITCDHTAFPGNSACHTGLLYYGIQQDGSLKAITPTFLDITSLGAPAK
jgi:branched-chain amino acid transport system substrate-binding protein